MWSDGSTTDKTVSWSIGKAAGSMTLSASSVTLNASNLTKTVTVTRPGDGAVTATSSNTSVQYAYYSAGNSKVKYRHSATGSAAYWWERSPDYNNYNNFCYVHTTGTANNYYARYSFGLAPAFMV